MMMNNSQNMTYWNSHFNTPDGSRLGLMSNAYNLGSIGSFFIVPYIADWFGRRIPIAVGCIIMIVGGIISTFGKDWQTYLAGRLILGFGNSMAQMCSPILLTEIAHPQHRARFTSVYNCLWNLGALSKKTWSAPLSLFCLPCLSLVFNRVWMSIYSQQLVLEDRYPPPNLPIRHSARFHLVDPRISKMAHQQGPC